MKKSRELGMQTFDQALFDLYEAGPHQLRGRAALRRLDQRAAPQDQAARQGSEGQGPHQGHRAPGHRLIGLVLEQEKGRASAFLSRFRLRVGRNQEFDGLAVKTGIDVPAISFGFARRRPQLVVDVQREAGPLDLQVLAARDGSTARRSRFSCQWSR